MSGTHKEKRDLKELVEENADEVTAPPSQVSEQSLTLAATATITAGEMIGGKPTEDLRVKKIFDDRFEVIEKLGAGGMSTVYKVRHIHLDKIFALKILHSVSAESVQRFQQEAKASSLLEHPNIVAIRDFGVTNEQQPFMVMDYLEGRSLSEIIKECGALAPKQVVYLFGQISAALAHAHAQGVVHRDIKPSNIMIKTRTDGTQHAILVDFGIAKLMSVETNKETSQQLTRTGDIFGTPFYMSPEQCQGRQVDARSDIYALGCVMFEALTGKVPFCGDSVYETIHKHINEAPQEFPDALRRLPIGRRLEALVLKAMAKVPQNRHKLMLELASELQQCDTGSGVMDEIRSFLGIMAARRKAAEARVILEKNVLQALTVFALAASLMIVFLPPEMERSYAQCTRDADIQRLVNRLLEQRFSVRKLMAHKNQGIFERLIILRKLCAGDPVLGNLFRDFDVLVGKSCIDVIKMQDETEREVLENGGFSTRIYLNMLGKFEVVALEWADASKVGSNLVSLSQERYVKNNEKLEWLSVCFLSAILGIFPISLGLIVLLFRSFKNKLTKHSSAPRKLD